MIFDHIGLITYEKKGDESWVEQTRVWVTNPKNHPLNVEWLRFEPDSECPEPLRVLPHLAYRVENLDEAARGMKTLVEPMVVDDFVRVGFYEYKDGSLVEFMEYLNDNGEWFPKQDGGDK
jgi:hypothetical protein